MDCTGYVTTHRNYTEFSIHSQKLAEKFVKDVIYCKNMEELNISTHSDVIINVLGNLVINNKVSINDIKLFVLNEDNSEITHTANFDEDGYLENWPYGFLDVNYSDLINTINKI